MRLFVGCQRMKTTDKFVIRSRQRGCMDRNGGSASQITLGLLGWQAVSVGTNRSWQKRWS